MQLSARTRILYCCQLLVAMHGLSLIFVNFLEILLKQRLVETFLGALRLVNQRSGRTNQSKMSSSLGFGLLTYNKINVEVGLHTQG